MNVGDLVKVKTKHYGDKFGVIVDIDKECGIRIHPKNHPRSILADPKDITWYGKIKSAVNNMKLV